MRSIIQYDDLKLVFSSLNKKSQHGRCVNFSYKDALISVFNSMLFEGFLKPVSLRDASISDSITAHTRN